ncbi:MAG TPA: PhaM family polyhydroxyalkanoate granule multifunctional regulatory protein [Methylibium sp.]|nr:PhaM family polyhydroxyalkanoate granule multifunctional regulatory protein [Methylibium sp.]
MAATPPEFAKMVPGFDFLQGLVKNAGSVLPNMGQWVAPTLDPDELDKRIEELRTVQFWLEQNARMLAATIQALEVQRMTLSTLKTMNVQVADLRESLRIKLPEQAAEAAPAAPAEPPPARKPAARKPKAAAEAPAAPAAAGVVDPTQWWGALTKQFTELAANAMKDATPASAQQLVQQSLSAAGQTLKAGMAPAQQAAKAAADSVARSAAGAKPARKPAAKPAPAKRAR